MTVESDPLSTVRAGYRRRGEAKTPGDRLYTVYAIVLVAAILGVPAVRALVVFLAAPPTMSALMAPAASRIIAVVCGASLVLLAGLGRTRGPVVLAPFFVTLLAGRHVKRSRALARPFRITAVALTSGLVTAAALMSGVFVWTGSMPWHTAIWFPIAAGCFGVIASVVWLIGARVPTGRGWILPVALAFGTLATAVLPALAILFTWGWVAATWPNAGAAPWAPALLGLGAIAACWSVPRLLDHLRGADLLEHAQRWQSARIAASAGDVAWALGTFRPLPSVGRRWNAVAGTNLHARFLIRDLTGALRTPFRFLIGVTFLMLAGTLVALTSKVSPALTWLPPLLGSGLGYLALGTVSDGFRHVAQATSAPNLYGYSTLRLYLLHATLPLALTLSAAVVGCGVPVLFGAQISSGWTAAVVLPTLVCVRAYDSAKGQLPLALMAPVPTPVGDANILNILAWQADALLIAIGAGTAIALAVAASNALLAVMIAAIVTLLLVLMLKRRLGALRFG